MATTIGSVIVEILAKTAGLESGVKNSNKSLSSLEKAASSAGRILGTLGVGFSAALITREALLAVDAYTKMTAQLRQVTHGQAEFAQAQQDVRRISAGAQADITTITSLYQRLSLGLQDAGKSQKDIADISETVALSLKVSGASAGEASSAMLQLSQAFGSGRLAGEEFKAVAESAPNLLRALATSIGVPYSALKEMASQGKLTSEVLADAFTDPALLAGLREQAKGMETISGSWQNFKNELVLFVGESGQTSGAVSLISGSVNGLANNFDKVVTVAEVLITILGARLVSSLAATTAGFVSSTYQAAAYQAALARMAGVSGAAAASATALNSALLLVGGPVGALVLIAGGLALMAERMETAQESTARLRKEMDTLNREQLENGIQLQKRHIHELERQIQAQTRSEAAASAVAKMTKLLNRELENEKKALQELERGMEGVEDREFEQNLIDMAGGAEYYDMWLGRTTKTTKEFERAVDDATGATKDSRTNTEFLNDTYQWLGYTVTNTGDAYVKLMGISDTASKSMVRDVEDLDAAINLIPSGLTKIGETSTEVAEQSAEEWMHFRDSMSDSFADLIVSGESWTDAIAKSFERMLAKMVADLAVSGIMNFLTGEGGYSFSGSLSGAGTSGKLISAGIQKFAPGLAESLGLGAAGTAATGAAASAWAAGLAGGTAALAPGAGVLALGNGGLALASGAGAAGTAAATGGGLAAAGSAIASGAQTALAAIPVAGWVALAAAVAWKVFGKESTPSHNAGLLLHDVPGAKANQKFDVDPFASGLDPVGFNRDVSRADAMQVIDVFRGLDKSIVDIANAAGLHISANAGTFSGLDERGLGTGVFLGSAGEKGKPGKSLESQLDLYTKQLIATLTGQLDGETLNRVLSAGNADQMIAALNRELSMDGSHAGGLNYVPFDGYRAELHRGERVQTAAEVTNLAEEMRQIKATMERLLYSSERTAEHTERTKNILTRVTRDGESLVTEAA